ncbi:nucleotidyltransferase domain-containing protein [Clostridiaceae bacterium M8S5]|nr:nucleotidyltransferase domain-containing protein [Clostridiaceae bacterium M8S5]
MSTIQHSIKIMKDTIVDILDSNEISIYIVGSVTSGDFKLGWSDIDILCLTKSPITDKQANKLVYLRQKLLKDNPNNKYFRLFEGGFMSFDTFKNKTRDTVVYWGTRGQRITETYHFDSFGMYELITRGLLLYGNDLRGELTMPTYSQLRNDVINHYETIRKYAIKTNRSIYSAGWMLDIARGIFTLKTGEVITKTKAGEWALEKQLCPTPETLIKAIKLRKNPMKYINSNEFLEWTESLGPDIQKFADIMQNEIFTSRSVKSTKH